MGKSKSGTGLSNREAVYRLKERAKTMKIAVEAEGNATEDEIAAHSPGGAENPDKGLWGWIRFSDFLLLRNAGAGSGGVAADIGEEIDRNFLVAFAKTPQPVVLSSKQVVHVYPKSLGALLDLHSRDLIIAWLLRRIAEMADAPGDTPDNLQHSTAAWEKLELQLQISAWILVTPGPGFPFDREAPERPVIPEEISGLQPEDLQLILAAHHRVNNTQLRQIDALFDLENNGKETHRPFRFSVFVATVADKLHVPAGQLMWDWTYAELLAQSAIAAGAHRQAYQDAEAESKRRRRRHSEDYE